MAALVDFEGGADSAPIRVSEPGIQFTTTNGQDWIYADWRTGNYNGPYPSGAYYSFGNFFAWLGPNQGFGRIDFDLDVAKQIRVRYSSYSIVNLEAYDAKGNRLDQDTGGGNLNTGSMGTLTVDNPGVAYVLFHDSGNYWLIDNLEFELTDVRVLEVDLQEDANEAKHHTEEYDDPIVFRRGQELNFNIVLTPGYQEPYYELELLIKEPGGTSPTTATPGNTIDATQWRVEFGEPQPKSWLPFFTFDDYVVVPAKVLVPFDIPIGKFEFSVKLQRQNGVGTPEVLAAEDPVYIIFNPWSNLDDDVYDSTFDDASRSQYVLREDGVIFVGENASGRKSWQFDQFDETVFLTTVGLVERLPVSARADARRVARHLSAVANVQDEGGVLSGNWSGNYAGGKSPTYWSSSEQIFDRYAASGPVKFGQCWVFAGILNSMSRTLGIPGRVVTNAPSAHDKAPFDGIITTYIDNPRASESIWNFHVWNEARLSRPDRGDFSGTDWQAFDGTPQEVSNGLRQAGPAPVAAIKAGAGGNYDVDFIRYEVQAEEQRRLFSPDTLLSTSPFRSKTMPTLDILTGGIHNRLNAYCSDCPLTSSTHGLWPWLYAGLQEAYSIIPGILFRAANATPQAGMHQVNVAVVGPVTVGGQINGTVSITNTGSLADTVTVLLFLYAQSSNGEVIAEWGRNSIPNQVVGAGQTISLPFAFSIPVTDKVLPGFDFYSLQVAVVGNQGTGAGKGNGVISGPTVTVSATTPDANGQSTVIATVNNLLPQSMTDVALTLDVSPEVTLLGQRTVGVGNISPSQSASASWTVELPPGSHDLVVEATATGLAPIHGNVVVSRLGPARISVLLRVPDTIQLGDSATAQIEVRNTGGENADVSLVVTWPTGLGGGRQTFQFNTLQPAESQTVSVGIQGNTVGQHGISALAEASTANGPLTSHATTLVTVQGSQLAATVALGMDTVQAGFVGDISLFVGINPNTSAMVTITATSSDANKRYSIFDGTERVLAQPLQVPAGGKTLKLRIEDAPTGGWIRITATPVENPAGSATTLLNILGSSPQVTVDDRVTVRYGAVRFDRRTQEFTIPATLTNTSNEDLAGPVWLVISSLSPNQATVTNASGNTADGRPYVQVIAEGVVWQAGQSLPTISLRIRNPIREPLNFEEQVLAIIP